MAQTYEAVRKVGVPNYRGARRPLDHGLNIAAWRKYENVIADKSLIDHLEFGFPAGYQSTQVPTLGLSNHSSAVKHPSHVEKYIDVELSHNALLGPFDKSPFQDWFRWNPLMTRPKRDSDDLRVILDLSFPEAESVNHGIPRQSLDAAPFKLCLPTPEVLANKIRDLGPGCLLYKADLSRAYRQLRSDPLDWPLLGLSWSDKSYVDVAIPFGLRHGASACQRTTEAVAQITKHKSGASPEPYVDDTIGAAIPKKAPSHYQCLLHTMEELGMDAAPHKCQSPVTALSWIGVHFDTIAMLMSIDRDRVQEAIALCISFLAATHTHKQFMQSFMGKIFHAIKCTHQARRFTARLLELLRQANNQYMVPITHEARLDAVWLAAFLPAFNGRTLIKPTIAQVVAHVDACLKGAGGHCQNHGYYHFAFPVSIRVCGFCISSLECYNVLMAVRLWAPRWAGKTVLLYTDNWATVAAAESGAAMEPLMRGAVRELWWICAINDIDLIIRHKPGAAMVAADALSRIQENQHTPSSVHRLFQDPSEKQLSVHHSLLLPPIPI